MNPICEELEKLVSMKLGIYQRSLVRGSYIENGILVI